MLSMLVDVKPEHRSNVEVALRQMKDMLRSGLRLYGISLVGIDAGYPRKPTREENMRMAPLAVHFGSDIWGDCTSKRSFPRSRVTNDWKKVTCKKCLKKRPQGEQKELF